VSSRGAHRELQTLTATGATSSTRRTLAAATAAGLALLGAALGTASAYIALIAGYLHDLDRLSRVPLLELGIIIIGYQWSPPWPAGCCLAVNRPS